MTYREVMIFIAGFTTGIAGTLLLYAIFCM